MTPMHGQQVRVPRPEPKSSPCNPPPQPPNANLAARQQEQASRYLTAVYGPDVLYRAPETFENLLERWIWSVASRLPDFGEECMAAIEAHCAEREA